MNFSMTVDQAPRPTRSQANTSVLNSAPQLLDLTGEWSELARQARDGSTFVTPAWILSWLEAYRPDAALRFVVTASEEGLIDGIAPLMLVDERRYGFSYRWLRFVGDGTNESDHLTFPARRGFESSVLPRLLEAVSRLDWDAATFANVPEESALAEAIPRWCDEYGFKWSLRSAPCPSRRIPPSYEQLLSGLPSRFRTSIRSTRKKLAASHAVEFGLHDAAEDFDEALQALFRNHESRWRAKGQAGVFVDPRRRTFYEKLTQRLHDEGALRFFYLKLDGRIVAQEYCFAHGRTVYLLQEGFDYAMAASNVGNALRSHVFEHLIDHGYETYDFLAGISRHKQNWSDRLTQDLTFDVARPTFKGRAWHHMPLWVEAAKSHARPWRDKVRALFAGAGKQTSSPEATRQ